MKAKILPNVVVLNPSPRRFRESSETAVDVEKWYADEFKNEWRESAAEIFGQTGVGRETDEETEKFLNVVKDHMSKYGNMFSFVGAGSERISFVTKDEKFCLKLCTPYDGYYQNQTQEEIRRVSEFSAARFLYRILDWDELSFSSSLCECCREATPESWKKTFGVSYETSMQICQQLFKHKTFSLPESLKEKVRIFTPENPGFVDSLLTGEEPAYASLKEWTQARIDSNGQKFRDAVDHIENWGITIENGKPAVKIIDAGL